MSSTILTSTQKTLQSAENLIPLPATGPTAQVFSQGDSVTQLQTVTSSVIQTSNSVSVTDGTTADSTATYIGSNGGTPMFAIKNPNGTAPPNLNNPLAAPAIPGLTPQGFNDNGTISQGLIGKL
jgi:hypothetical protein